MSLQKNTSKMGSTRKEFAHMEANSSLSVLTSVAEVGKTENGRVASQASKFICCQIYHKSMM